MAAPVVARPTISQVAAMAGVSLATVSKVLNDRPDVAADTRARVRAALDESGYLRRGIRRRTRVGLIDLVIVELDSPWSIEVIRSVEEVAHAADVGVVVSALHGSRRDARKWLESLFARRSDGVVLVVSELTSRQREQLVALDVPVVMVDPVGEPDSTFPSVGATNWAGGRAAAEHLLALGHTRIGMICGPAQLLCSRARLDGFRAALAERGVVLDPRLVQDGDFQYDSGRTGTQALLSLAEPPTAIFAASDMQAFGAYAALRELGLAPGVDVSVVGFDDIPACEWVTPRLTTVRQPLAEMAALATTILLDAINGLKRTPTNVELATRLIERDSTTPCGAAAR